MKFITFFILYLTFSQISLNICGTISRSHRYRRTNRIRKNIVHQAKNKWYQLFLGLLFGLAGVANDVSSLNECIPQDWRAVDTDKIPENGSAPQDKTTLLKIIDGVEKVVNFVCAFKNQITKLLGKRIRRLLRRNRYRMFVETRVNLRKTLWFWKKIKNAFKNIGRAIKNTAVKIGNKIKNTAVNIGNKIKNTAINVFEKVKGFAMSVGDWVKKKWEEVKAFATGIISNIKVFWSHAVNTIKVFFSGDLIKKITNIIKCALKLKDLIMGLVGVFKGVMNRISQITRIAALDFSALAMLIVDLICNFSLFKQAFIYLIDSIHEKETINKFSLVGKFLGTALRSLVVRKMAHRKH